MSGKLFNWKDVYRIAESVFADIPEDEQQWRAWSGTLLYITSTSRYFVRQRQNYLEAHPNERREMYSLMRNSMLELDEALSLFPEYKLDELMKDFVQELYQSLGGYVEKVL